MKEVSPTLLLVDSTKPRKLQLDAVYASELCEPFRLKLMGLDLKLSSVQKLTSAAGACPDYSLSFFSSSAFAHLLDGIHNCAILTKSELGEIVVGSGNTALVVDDPKSAFFSILAHLIDTHRYEMLSAFRHPSAQVASSASIFDNVYLDKDVVIGEHVRIFPNTYVGAGCTVQAGSVIGNGGYEPVVFNGRRQFPAHAGGVWLSPGSTVGTNTCVDKGYFGEFTFVGERTFVGSFVQMAHSVSVSSDSEIGSGTQIAGFCEIGENVSIGPHATILQNTKIGSHCRIGAGSLVLRELPAHALVQGSAPVAELSAFKGG